MDSQHTPMPAGAAGIIARIKYLMDLKRLNQSSFARAVGVDAATVSRVLGSDKKPSESFLNRIVVNLGVSKEWLADGSDLPFPKSSHQKASRQPEGAPVYNIDVTAGTTSLSRMFTDERIIGRVCLPGIDPSLPIVRVSGDSMTPRLLPGCFISIRSISLDAPISWGRIYVVVLPDYRLVKYVRRNADPALVTLVSANPAYDDIEVPRADIEGLYLVENVINHDFLA
ncbi:MAG: XRE family transcriptional regulator [Muribaculaceae bacterium]|nr:XRE family transcriptional regulator [Muribaculaceae bacterium]